MRPGKLPPKLLEVLLARGGAARGTAVRGEAGSAGDASVVLGPGLGRDAAVVQIGDRLLVLAADPVSFAPERPAWHAVHVNANDVACLGADPRWFLATVLLPEASDEAALEPIFDDLREGCAEVGATLVGGHTEVSAAVQRIVIAGTMIGEAPAERLFASDAARPGDALLQLGPVAIEGTALLAHAIPDRLRAAGLRPDEIEAAAALLREPGISVLAAARAAWELPGVHSLHDPTEGGIATACWELAEAAGTGLQLEAERVIRHPLTDRLAAALALDPLGLLASGALLVTIEPGQAEAGLAQLHSRGMVAAQIGTLGGASGTAILRANGASRPLPRFLRDEVARALA